VDDEWGAWLLVEWLNDPAAHGLPDNRMPARGGYTAAMNAILLAVAAGLCWGIGELFTKSVLHTGKVGPLTAIAVRSTVALPVIWLAYALAVHHWQLKSEPRNWLQADAATLAKLMLGSGLVAGAGGMICFYVAISLGEISKVKPIAFTVAPTVAVVLAWLVLGEPLTLRKALGVALVVAGVALIAWRAPALSAA
jgi:bacterial/archaeal transporter family protein